jgi:hypothetical protein
VEAKHARRAVNAGRHGGGAVSIRWTKCMRRAEEQANFQEDTGGAADLSIAIEEVIMSRQSEMRSLIKSRRAREESRSADSS